MNLKKFLALTFAASLTANAIHAADESSASPQTSQTPPESSGSDSASYETLYQKWRAANPADRKKITSDLWSAIIDSQGHIDEARQVEICNAITSNGQFAAKTIQPSLTAKKISARVLQRFGTQNIYFNEWVIRRMTDNRFEFWVPPYGRLFNSNGKLLNTVDVPNLARREHQWYGAFLADGRYVVMDWNGVLEIHSRRGKWLNNITLQQLVPQKSKLPLPWNPRLFAWARCDYTGEKWITEVDDDFDDPKTFLITPSGAHRLLKSPNASWRFCYPRDLEPKGWYLRLSLPSDDDTAWLDYEVVGHGSNEEFSLKPHGLRFNLEHRLDESFPNYSFRVDVIASKNDLRAKLNREAGYQFKPHEHKKLWRRVIYTGSQDSGFWPNSHHIYIGSDGDRMDADPAGTWFFDAKGNCKGWLAATRIGDAASGSSMIFANGDQVITLSPKLKVTAIRQFTLPDGTALIPVKIFDDLHLGFFKTKDDDALMLVSWKS